MPYVKPILTAVFIILVLFSLVLSSWYVLHGDINFSSDIARDFLLYGEIQEKGIVFIGPRSSVSGLFHGPAWLYLNFPAYVLGGGNPVVVGWFWVILIAASLVLCFYIAKNLFGKQSAYIYVLFMSVYSVFHARSLFNPHGVYFLLPLFFYLLLRYENTRELFFLISHFIVGGLLIQFQIAIGIPYILLSSLYLFISILRSKHKKHLLSFFIIPLMLSNFILFDFRHEHQLGKALLRYSVSHTRDSALTFDDLAVDRFQTLMTGIEFARERQTMRNIALIVFALLIVAQIRDKKYKKTYLLFLYLYGGYILLSFINTGRVLYFYIYPQFSLIFLIFASFSTSKYKKAFIVFFLFLYALNLKAAISNMRQAESYIGTGEDSWKGLYDVSQSVYEDSKGEFGYFVYSPDILGYSPKYAMKYADKIFEKQGFSFVKMPVTYLIIAPPPPDNPFMHYEWWRENQVHIQGEPEKTTSYPNGYIVEKYILTEDEIAVPFDKSIDPGIHFR